MTTKLNCENSMLIVANKDIVLSKGKNQGLIPKGSVGKIINSIEFGDSGIYRVIFDKPVWTHLNPLDFERPITEENRKEIYMSGLEICLNFSKKTKKIAA